MAPTGQPGSQAPQEMQSSRIFIAMFCSLLENKTIFLRELSFYAQFNVRLSQKKCGVRRQKSHHLMTYVTPGFLAISISNRAENHHAMMKIGSMRSTIWQGTLTVQTVVIG